jgi:hypothetical protein
MNTLQPTPRTPSALASDPRWQLILRITDSKSFQKSQRLRDFLLYVAEHTLLGNSGDVNEQLIGVRVFGRDANYSPAEDNLVRVTARSLRTKLAEYYAGEGAGESLRVEIPKGSYQPEFFETTRPPADVPTSPWRMRLALGGLMLLLAVLGFDNWRLRSTRPLPPQNIVSKVFHRYPGNVQVVLTDSSMALMNNILGRHLTLDEYTGRGFETEERAKLTTAVEHRIFNVLTTRQITSWADIRLIQRLGELDSVSPGRFQYRHPRHMQVRDFKDGNFIVMATAPSNPWVELFESNLNFQARVLERPHHPGFGQAIVNVRPLAGEQGQYSVASAGRNGQTSPVRIASIPSLNGSGRVLLIAGITMEGTEAGVEYVSDTVRLQDLERRLNSGDLAQLTGWEVLLEAGTLQGTARSSRILATRATR